MSTSPGYSTEIEFVHPTGCAGYATVAGRGGLPASAFDGISKRNSTAYVGDRLLG
jgi:hypothetical protein